MFRRTVSDIVSIEGIGLHRGSMVHVTVESGEAGINFIRNGVRIPASPEFVIDTRLNTMLGKDGEHVSTVEHMMSALYGLGITDCDIIVDGDEMPVMDGSALPILSEIKMAGMRSFGSIEPVTINAKLKVGNGNSWLEIEPGDFGISYFIDFPEPAIGIQRCIFDGASFETEIAPARTFGRLKDVDAMRSMGLALGGNLDNAVVVDEDRILNPEGLRFPNECVRHKVLDLLGDFWLLGRPVTGRIKAFKANHRLHVELAKKVASLSEAYGR